MENGFQVLLAEDDVDHVILLKRALRRFQRPVDLRVASDGQAALELLREGLRPQLMLVDINMPRLTGVEFLRTVRSTAEFKSIPAVMLTTSAREEDRTASLAAGADEYLIKPVNFRKFADALVHLLERYQS